MKDSEINKIVKDIQVGDDISLIQSTVDSCGKVKRRYKGVITNIQKYSVFLGVKDTSGKAWQFTIKFRDEMLITYTFTELINLHAVITRNNKTIWRSE